MDPCCPRSASGGGHVLALPAFTGEPGEAPATSPGVVTLSAAAGVLAPATPRWRGDSMPDDTGGENSCTSPACRGLRLAPPLPLSPPLPPLPWWPADGGVFRHADGADAVSATWRDDSRRLRARARCTGVSVRPRPPVLVVQEHGEGHGTMDGVRTCSVARRRLATASIVRGAAQHGACSAPAYQPRPHTRRAACRAHTHTHPGLGLYTSSPSPEPSFARYRCRRSGSGAGRPADGGVRVDAPLGPLETTTTRPRGALALPVAGLPRAGLRRPKRAPTAPGSILEPRNIAATSDGRTPALDATHGAQLVPVQYHLYTGASGGGWRTGSVRVAMQSQRGEPGDGQNSQPAGVPRRAAAATAPQRHTLGQPSLSKHATDTIYTIGAHTRPGERQMARGRGPAQAGLTKRAAATLRTDTHV